MKNSQIQWTNHTFNPWMDCTKVSPACKYCYPEVLVAKRYKRVDRGKGASRQLTSDTYWKAPLGWNLDAAQSGVRSRVFCASVADVFDAEVDPAWRQRLWALIRVTPNLDWLLLTKRPRMFKTGIPWVVARVRVR